MRWRSIAVTAATFVVVLSVVAPPATAQTADLTLANTLSSDDFEDGAISGYSTVSDVVVVDDGYNQSKSAQLNASSNLVADIPDSSNVTLTAVMLADGSGSPDSDAYARLSFDTGDEARIDFRSGSGSIDAFQDVGGSTQRSTLQNYNERRWYVLQLRYLDSNDTAQYRVWEIGNSKPNWEATKSFADGATATKVRFKQFSGSTDFHIDYWGLGGLGEVFKQPITGRVVDNSGAPVAGATVRAITANETKLQQKYGSVAAGLAELNDTLDDPIPDSWDPSLKPGTSAFGVDGKYALVHAPSAWQSDDSLGKALINPDASDGSARVALSVWQSRDTRAIQDAIDRSAVGTVRDDTPVIVERLGAGGSVLGQRTITTDQTLDPGVGASTHQYQVVSLDAGVYRLYPKGARENAYTILVGDEQAVAESLSQQLRDRRDRLTKRAQRLQDLMSNSTIDSLTATTDSDGRFRIVPQKPFTKVRLTALKAPGAGLSPPISLADVQSARQSGFGGAILSGESKGYVTAPATGVTVRVQAVSGTTGPGSIQPCNGSTGTGLEIVIGCDSLKTIIDTPVGGNTSGEVDLKTIRSAIRTHTALSEQVSQSPPTVAYFCSQFPADCGSGGNSLAIRNVTVADAESLDNTDLQEIQTENERLATALRDGPQSIDPGNGNGGIDDGVPETFSKVVKLPFKLKSLDGLTVTAIYDDASNEPIGGQYLSIQQGYGPGGTQSAVKIEEWPVPEGKGAPDRIATSLTDGRDGSLQDPADEAGLLNATVPTGVDLTNASFVVGATLADGRNVTLPDSTYSIASNDSAVVISEWPVPQGTSVADTYVNILSRDSRNESDFSASQNLLNATIGTFGANVSEGGNYVVQQVNATTASGGNRTIPTEYWSVTANDTGIEVDSWPIPSDVDTVTGLDVQVALGNETGDQPATNDTATYNNSVTVGAFDLTTDVGVKVVRAWARDGTQYRIPLEYVSTSGSSTVTVDNWPIPDGETIARDQVSVHLDGGIGTAASVTSGTIDLEWNTGYSLDRPGDNDDLVTGELFIDDKPGISSTGAVINYSDGSTSQLEWDGTTAYLKNDTYVVLNGYDGFNSSKTVSGIHLYAQRSGPDQSSNEDGQGTRVLTTTLSTDVPVQGSNFTVANVTVSFNDGTQTQISRQYWSISGTNSVQVSQWPIPDGQEVASVTAQTRVIRNKTDGDRDRSAAANTLNRTITLDANVSLPSNTVTKVVAVFASGGGTTIDEQYWSLQDGTTLEVNSWPVPEGRTVDVVRAPVVTGSPDNGDGGDDSTDRNESVDADPGTIIDQTVTFSTKIGGNDTVTATVHFADGTADVVADEYVSVTGNGFKVQVSGYEVPDGQTVEYLDVDVTRQGVDTVKNVTDDRTVRQAIPLRTDATASDLTVRAVYSNGSTAKIGGGYWTLDGRTLRVQDWPVPPGAPQVDSVNVSIAGVDNVTSNVTDNSQLSLTVPFDGGSVTGSDLEPKDVTVLAHLSTGETTNISAEYWRINNNVARDDEVVVENWPVPPGVASVDVEVLVSGPDGSGSFRQRFRNPGFAGSIPRVDALRLNTQYPSVGQGIRVTAIPDDPSVFGRIQSAEVVEPNGSTLAVRRPTNRTVQAVPRQTGPHTVRLTLANEDGETVERTLTVQVRPTARQAPPTLRVSREPTGTAAVVSDGFVRGQISREEGRVTVNAVLASSRDAPPTTDLYISDLPDETKGAIAVDVDKPGGRDLARQTTVRVHVSRLPEGAHVRSNGVPVTVAGQINRSQSQAVVTVPTGPNGEATISINRNPGLLDQLSYEVDELTASIDVPGLGGGTQVLTVLPAIGLLLGGRRRRNGGVL